MTGLKKQSCSLVSRKIFRHRGRKEPKKTQALIRLIRSHDKAMLVPTHLRKILINLICKIKIKGWKIIIVIQNKMTFTGSIWLKNILIWFHMPVSQIRCLSLISKNHTGKLDLRNNCPRGTHQLTRNITTHLLIFHKNHL